MSATDPTPLDNLVDPQVMQAMISAKLPNVLRFGAIAPVDTTLQGQAGTTITYPRWKYIGPAVDFAEGESIDYRNLETENDTFTIKRIGVGTWIYDTAVKSGLGDPIGEGSSQLLMSISDKMDNDVLGTAMKARLKLPADTDVTSIDLIDKIEDAFGSDVDEHNTEDESTYATGVLFMNPRDVSKLRAAASINWTRATELGDQMLIKGTFGEILGWQIVRARKIPEGSALAVKPGALRTFVKSGVEVERARDIDRKATKVNADAYYGVAIYDDTKILAINPVDIDGATVIDDNVTKVPDTNVTASKKRKVQPSGSVSANKKSGSTGDGGTTDPKA